MKKKLSSNPQSVYKRAQRFKARMKILRGIPSKTMEELKTEKRLKRQQKNRIYKQISRQQLLGTIRLCAYSGGCHRKKYVSSSVYYCGNHNPKLLAARERGIYHTDNNDGMMIRVVDLGPPLGRGIQANEDLSVNSVITFYDGFFSPTDRQWQYAIKKRNVYCMEWVKGVRCIGFSTPTVGKGLGSFFNKANKKADANCRFYVPRSQDKKGKRKRVYVITTKNVIAHQMLWVESYGSHFKWSTTSRDQYISNDEDSNFEDDDENEEEEEEEEEEEDKEEEDEEVEEKDEGEEEYYENEINKGKERNDDEHEHYLASSLMTNTSTIRKTQTFRLDILAEAAEQIETRGEQRI
jgi:hypothetical protein